MEGRDDCECNRDDPSLNEGLGSKGGLGGLGCLGGLESARCEVLATY